MKLLKTILDFYIRSSLHVAFCFLAFAIVYNESYELYVPFGYYVFLFCAAVAGYNLIKFVSIWLKTTLKSNLSFKIITLTAALFALFVLIIMEMSIHAWILMFFVILVNLFYVLPIWKGKGLRYSPFFKLFSVAIVWSVLIIAIPQFIYYDSRPGTAMEFSEFRLFFGISEFIEIHTLKIFTMVIALCIPFEIRDLKYDEDSLHTLPQVLGIHASKYIGLLLCVLYAVLIGYGHNKGLTYLNSEIIIVVIIAIAIWFSDKFKSDYYASFFVEAIPVLWLALYYVFH